MPNVTKAERDRIYTELASIRQQWDHIGKFLEDEKVDLAPIYQRWLRTQDHD